MNRNESSRSFGRFGARATTFAGLAAATAAFVSLRGGFFSVDLVSFVNLTGQAGIAF